MEKLNRNYSLMIETRDRGMLEITPPFTLEFDINRNILSSASTSSFRIYNLNPNNRNNIRFDSFDFGVLRTISMKAGYGNDNLSTVFHGNINRAWSVREGTNFITQIESFDGGFAFVNAQSNVTVPKNMPFVSIVGSLVGDLSKFGVTPGAIGSFTGILTRGNSYSGSTTDLLKDLSGGGFFIDNGKAHCLKDGEALQGEVLVINSASGLLGTPMLEETFLKFDILFEPRLIIGQKIRLESITGANFNSEYKVISLHHKGMISATVCGSAITTIGVAYGPAGLQVVGL